MSLTTERLQLRMLAHDDAEFLYQLMNEPAYHQNIGDRGVRTHEDAIRYMDEKFLPSFKKSGFGFYCVTMRDTQRAIGIAGLLKRDGLPEIDIGFAILSEFWGLGYATEASRALIEYARHELKLKKLLGITSQENLSSGRVLEKIGLKLDGRVILPNDTKELNLYSVTFGED